ncbi:DUF4221 family protein [Roseivirga sp. E12]|uniref:DUF4221 family protein n=1 Tax=Roseivirga sp. E12 TaxID=2819237 RepID=UPI001ABC9626|nr:DUF4221 family protein [Roseivirga sp. E12]MBO3699136.1 DUF4221 family protein [Roseivirga sp. E12]
MYRKQNKAIWVIWITAFIMTSGCSESRNEVKNKNDNKLTKRLVITDTLNIQLPDTITHLNNESRPFFSSDEKSFSYLTESFSDVMSLNRYSFEKNDWTVTRLHIQGPNQVYSLGAFSGEHDDGSFYYLPTIAPHILKVSSKGNVLENYEYSPNRDLAYNSQVKSPNIYDDGESIYFDLGEYRDLKNTSTFEEAYLIGAYNYKTNELKKLIHYPDEFRNKKWSTNDVGRNSVILKNRIYMSFSKSKKIYVYDLAGEFIKESEAGIDAIDESQGLESNDPFQNALAQINNGYYHTLIYDKWQKLFYRLAIHFDIENKISDPQDLGRAFQKRTLTILTFDENLNIVSKDSFLTAKSFISEEFYLMLEDGLYLNLNTPSQPENEYSFIKLTLIDQ